MVNVRVPARHLDGWLAVLAIWMFGRGPAPPEESEVVFDEVNDLPAPEDPVAAGLEEMLSQMSVEDKASAMFIILGVETPSSAAMKSPQGGEETPSD